MNDQPTYPWDNPAANGLKQPLFSDVPAPEEIERWGQLVFQALGRGAARPRLKEELAMIAGHHIQTQYNPFWFIKNKVLSGYICQERRRRPSDVFTIGDGRTLYDLMLLNRSVDMLREMQERKEQTLLILPVHVQTLCSRRPRELLRHYFENYGKDVNRGLVLMIQGLDDQRLLESDFEHIQRFAPFCRAFIIEMPARATNLTPYIKLKVHACGFAADSFKGDEKKLFDTINNHVIACEKFGLKSFLIGVDKVSVMSTAIASGITYLEGPAVAPEQDKPKHVELLNIDSVYTPHIFPEK